jgi:hypothetical protein
MFELTNYLQKATSFNEEIVGLYNMHISLADSNCITMKNQYCQVEFSTGKYYLDFQFFLTVFDGTKSKKMNSIELFDINKIVVKEVLDSNEQQKAKAMTDEIERYLYIYAIVLKKKLSRYLEKMN